LFFLSLFLFEHHDHTAIRRKENFVDKRIYKFWTILADVAVVEQKVESQALEDERRGA
jgi:hypothetical protein